MAVKRKSPKRKASPKRRKASPKRKSPKRKTLKRKSPRRKSPKRKSPKRKSPKRKKKSPKRKSPKRRSPRRRTPRRRTRPTDQRYQSRVSGAEMELQEASFKQRGLRRCTGRYPIRCYNEPGVRIPGACVRRQKDCYSYKIAREAGLDPSPSPTFTGYRRPAPNKLRILLQSRQRARFL